MHTLSTTAVVLAVATRVSAECMVPPPPCEALARSSMVFVGKAIAAGPFERTVGPNGYQLIDQAVRFRVIERFKGVAKAQKELVGSIAFQIDNVLLVAGPRYLVYAKDGSDGRWYTGCSRTGTLERRFDDVRQLRSCRGASRP